MSIKAYNRPARIVDYDDSLDQEFRNARWTYHRLLDFEDAHQAVIDAVMPELARVSSIMSRLHRRKRRASRSTKRELGHHPELLAKLGERRLELKKQRDSMPEWKAAKSWDRDVIPDDEVIALGLSPKKVRRKAGESDESFLARQASASSDRRRVNNLLVYRESRCHRGSYSAALDSAKQARSYVMRDRSAGKPAKIRRPRWSDRQSLVWQGVGSIRHVGSGNISVDGRYWCLTLPIGRENGKVKIRMKIGDLRVPDEHDVLEVKLTRERVAGKWRYSISVTIDADWPTTARSPDGAVGMDWGHRRMLDGSIRAWTLDGSDGFADNIVLPAELMKANEAAQAEQSRADELYVARKSALGLRARNRHTYQSHLERTPSDELTTDEAAWLAWHNKICGRIAKKKRRIRNKRKEIYLQEARRLRARYETFYVEKIVAQKMKDKQTDDQMARKSRQARDIVAAYKFKEMLAKQYGATVVEIDPRNTSRECPSCGHVSGPTSDVEICCEKCGLVRDRDAGAAIMIRRKGEARTG